MIRQLEWMNGDGVFEGFRWDNAVPEFACINVIYGHNGVGKTSLAKALDAARSQAGDCERLSLRIDEQGATRSTNGQADPVYERLLVFCEMGYPYNYGGGQRSQAGRADNGVMSDTSPGEQSGDKKGVFMRLSPGGSAGSALSAGFGAFDVFFNPAAARAREELEQQHERVVPVPSPGDKMLTEGTIVIEVPGR